MLNIFKLNLNKYKNNTKVINKQEKYINYYPSSIKEWNNSIYVYNKNIIKLIPVASMLTLNLIKSYFNLYNHQVDRAARERRLIRKLRRFSSNKMFVSNGEFKHTNNKVIITLYMFNRQKYNYLNIIEKRFKRIIKNYAKVINNRCKLIKDQNTQILEKANKKKLLLLKTLQVYKLDNKKFISHKGLSEYITKFYKKLIQNSLEKFELFLYYKQLLLINRFKLSYTYLQYLKKYLEKIYNKNVVFNLVELRQLCLNSDILSESIAWKIKKDRKRILRFLKLLKTSIKIHKKNFLYISKLNKFNTTKIIQINKNSLQKVVLNNIKYKHLSGVRIEATGRLTKRYTASRSVTKLIQKGSLLNIDSSFNGLSTKILRGNQITNLQYTKIRSKTRIGSFGIKGWVSGS